MRELPFALACVLGLVATACSNDAGSRVTLAAEPPIAEIAGRPFHERGIDGWLVARPDGTVDAFWARSPHLGCYVMLYEEGNPLHERLHGLHEDQRGVFRDVCYGSTFTYDGRRVFGPAERGLDRFEVIEVLDESTVVVDFSRVRLGDCGHDDATFCSSPSEPRYVEGPLLSEWPAD